LNRPVFSARLEFTYKKLPTATAMRSERRGGAMPGADGMDNERGISHIRRLWVGVGGDTRPVAGNRMSVAQHIPSVDPGQRQRRIEC
jgi:hypothetical protein